MIPCAELTAQSIAQESQQQTRSAAKQVAEQQAQLASIAEQHNARMEELYIKFAAVLNEKKRKCQELQRALETAQATLQVRAAHGSFNIWSSSQP